MIFETARGQAIPTLTQVKEELRKLTVRSRRRRVYMTFLLSFSITFTGGLLILLLFLPVLEVSGSSMEPTLQDGDILVLCKSGAIEAGEMCGMYAQGRLILKRVIGLPGDVVNMDENGAVYLNGLPLKEPYISRQAVGTCDMAFPFTVPDDSLFVMGDHRETSIDSRSSLIGCVRVNEVMGQVVARIWPPKSFGWVK